MSEEIFSSAVEGSSEFWIPEGSDHVKSYADYPEDYLERLLQFLNASFK